MTEHSGNATVFYIEGSRTRQSEVYCPGAYGGSCYFPNTAWFCEQCGELWAREVYHFHFVYRPIPQKPWCVKLQQCPACDNNPELVRQELLKLLELYP